MTVMVTGGAGFIGSNFVIDWLANNDEVVVNLDILNYAGNLANLASLENDERHIFIKGDIGDIDRVSELLAKHRPRAVINFAAETHVDRSIHGPGSFIHTNIVGSFNLLESIRHYFMQLDPVEKSGFRFLHVSTDEVYGSLGSDAPAFLETSPYQPNNPYSASKASSDHLVRAYHQTYGIPVLTTNCSNNYGPYQFPEKFISLMIMNATHGKALPVYGDGQHRRDWLYVGDHCHGIRAVLKKGRPGEIYNIGGNQELSNLEVVHQVCKILDQELPGSSYRPHANLIEFVADRPGHDRRYAINATKIIDEIGWQPVETFETGIRKTVAWYLANQEWVTDIAGRNYQNWVKQNYGART